MTLPRRIYLDHTATTPVAPEVFEAMRPFFTETFGNASSSHAFGRDAKSALENARGILARAIGAEPGEVFFTSGGTEADNFALRGVMSAAKASGRNRIVTSATEHHAVLETCESLEKEGMELVVVAAADTGSPHMEDLAQAVDESTALVSVMHANNEVGTVSLITEISGIARAQGSLMHTDAVQSLGKIPVEVTTLGVDLMSMSAHKLYGPKGIGALYVRRGVAIDPLLHGGGQERKRRPGTESVALAVGFAKAVELATGGMQAESVRLRGLRDNLLAAIHREYPEVILNGDTAEGLPHILNISFDSTKIRLEGEMLLVSLDLQGIAASSGSACTSGSVQPSHVLMAMGRDRETAKATLRFSFGKTNGPEDVDAVVKALRHAVRG